MASLLLYSPGYEGQDEITGTTDRVADNHAVKPAATEGPMNHHFSNTHHFSSAVGPIDQNDLQLSVYQRVPEVAMSPYATDPQKYMAFGHQVTQYQDQYDRLRCFVLDFILSPTLRHEQTSDQPFFKLADSRYPDLGTCYQKEFSHTKGNLARVMQCYDLLGVTDQNEHLIQYPVIGYIEKIIIKLKTVRYRCGTADREDYGIECTCQVYYPSGKPIVIENPRGLGFYAWEVRLGPIWKMSDHYRDTRMARMPFVTMVDIIRLYVTLGFDNYGYRKPEHEVAGWVMPFKFSEYIDAEMWQILKTGGFGLYKTSQLYKNLDRDASSAGSAASPVAGQSVENGFADGHRELQDSDFEGAFDDDYRELQDADFEGAFDD